MTCHIAICDDDSRDAGYVSELLHQWAQLRGCAVTEDRSFCLLYTSPSPRD